MQARRRTLPDTATISLTSAPGTPSGAVTDIDFEIDDAGKSIVNVTNNNDGTISVTPAQPGTAMITVKAMLFATKFSTLTETTPSLVEEGTECSFTFPVTVSDIELKSITISEPQSSPFYVGDTQTLTITYNPSNATNKDITWTSSDDSIVKAERTAEGTATVTAVNGGEATITATATNGVTTSITLTVAASEPPAENKPEEPATPETPETPETPTTPQQPSSGGGGGCSAGLGTLALLALALMLLRRKK